MGPCCVLVNVSSLRAKRFKSTAHVNELGSNRAIWAAFTTRRGAFALCVAAVPQNPPRSLGLSGRVDAERPSNFASSAQNPQFPNPWWRVYPPPYPKAPRRSPKASQRNPKASQSSPKGAPKHPKETPKHPKGTPKAPQRAPEASQRSLLGTHKALQKQRKTLSGPEPEHPKRIPKETQNTPQEPQSIPHESLIDS